jgi:hypothetical protein
MASASASASASDAASAWAYPQREQLVVCDEAAPERHVRGLSLQYCAAGQRFPGWAWRALAGSLRALAFLDCFAAPPEQMPPELRAAIAELRVQASLGASAENAMAPSLPGAWIGSFHGVAALAVRDVAVSAPSLGSVVAAMPNLRDLSFCNANLSGPLLPARFFLLPSPWKLQALQICGNELLRGPIHASIARLRRLASLDLSANALSGSIPAALGNLSSLQTLILSSNRLSGTIPPSLRSLASLRYLDLSQNRLRGTVPAFLARLPSLRYLDLSNNRFRGALPFNETFLRSLNTFRVSGNAQLCFNASSSSASSSSAMATMKLLTGLPPCDDSTGLPVPSSSSSSGYGYGDLQTPSPSPSPAASMADGRAARRSSSDDRRHGPKKIVLIVAVGLACIVAVIVASILLSRCCSSKH